MIIRYIASIFIILLFAQCIGKEKGSSSGVAKKEIYKPEEFADDNWDSEESNYSYHRMVETDNIVIFWEKGFGDDPGLAPFLDGNSMRVDIENLKDRLERFYLCFRDTLKFVKEGSLSEKYKMMCMVRYSLEGVAYGGSYDDKIGALWVTPNRLNDMKQNVLAHELGHSFQSQIIADGAGEAWGGCGFFEMASQWMLWYVNRDWMTDENYHWDAFKEKTHKAFLHLDNIYHSPYVLESWSEKHGLPFIAGMFRQGTADEDPIITYKRMTDMSWDEFADEMFGNYQQLVNLDYSNSYSYTRKWANSFAPFKNKMDVKEDWYWVKPDYCPENYGFNVIKIEIPKQGSTVKVQFEGITNHKGYNIGDEVDAGWRYGFLGIKKDGSTVKSDICKDKKGTAEIVIDDEFSELWFIVMGAPVEYRKDVEAQWPYKIKVTGTSIL